MIVVQCFSFVLLTSHFYFFKQISGFYYYRISMQVADDLQMYFCLYPYNIYI